ncbi:MAG: hypothetical protein GY729_07025 [Desulfobacteraceae bacterium]|nr:hypothetical protein [Desulfobacteraceae bacterium]
MPEWIKELVNNFWPILTVVGLPAIGGAVSYLNKSKKEFSLWSLCVGMLTAGFVGLVVHYLLQSMNMHMGVKSAIIGISGYASRDVLLLLKTRLIKAAAKKEVI